MQQLPQGLTGEEGADERPTQARFDKERLVRVSREKKKQKLLFFVFSQRYRDLRGKSVKKSRTWIMEKKERWRNKGR